MTRASRTISKYARDIRKTKRNAFEWTHCHRKCHSKFDILGPQGYILGAPKNPKLKIMVNK